LLVWGVFNPFARVFATQLPVGGPPPTRGPQQRLYRRKEIEFLLALKELLYERGFTIAGARKRIAAGLLLPPAPPETTILSPAQLLLREVENDLRSLRARLEMPP
jgi:DNA-binding transcriptional MerR regulator